VRVGVNRINTLWPPPLHPLPPREGRLWGIEKELDQNSQI
jgi:hypothetical protein